MILVEQPESGFLFLPGVSTCLRLSFTATKLARSGYSTLSVPPWRYGLQEEYGSVLWMNTPT